MASLAPDPDTVNEAIHHKTLAESSFTSGDLTSALNHARKALILSPNTEGVSSMVTAFETITSASSSEGDAPDWYKILKVEPFSHLNTVKQQYRKLALALHPDKNPYVGCEEGFKLVNEAFKVLSDHVRRSDYDLKLRIKIQGEIGGGDDETSTFSTACLGCGFVHKFDRKYLGQSLMCASCKKSFEGKEEEGRGGACSSKIITYTRKRKKRVGEVVVSETREEEAGALNALESLDEEDEGMMTLAEMQSVLKRNKPKNSTNNKNGKREALKVKRSTKKNHKELIEIVEDEDFELYDFDKERMPRSFKKGQVWAIYDGGDDNMPRSYCVVSEVVSLNPFKVWISWLDYESEKLISWMKNSSSHHTPCGRFRVSEKALIEHVKLFSHVVNCERVAREVYQIYPKKGSVWAVYSETSTSDQRRKSKHYEIVVCLSMYSDAYGLSVAYLEKVNDNLFKRRGYGCDAVRWVEKEDVVALLSHQIPAKKVQEDQSGAGGRESWVLDLASVPPDMVSATE